MAGSLRWFQYLDDSGEEYAIFADESNTELVNTGAATALPVQGLTQLPKSIKPRYITLSNDAGTVKRKCFVLTPTRYAALNTATNFELTPANFSGVSATTVVSLVLKQPEISRRLPKNADTGLNDGDNP